VRAAAAEDVLDERLDLVLAHAGPRRAHGLAVRLGGDVGGALHQLDLFGGLEEPHLVEDGAGVGDGVRRLDALAPQRAHPRELADDRQVEFGLPGAEPVVEAVRAVEEVGQLLLKLLDGEGGVGAELLLRALDAGPPPRPDLLLGVARADEEREALVLRRRDDGDGIGLLKAGQVVEIRVLTEAVLGVVRARHLARAGQDGDGVRLHAPHELGELRSRHQQSLLRWRDV
jgi:hypothetical protein